MEITKSNNKKNNSIFKGIVLMTVLLSLILLPILSNADSGVSRNNTVGNPVHGYLVVSASDVTFPATSSITEQQIISQAKPTAIHICEFYKIDEPVRAEYSISESDLEKVNEARSTNSSVTITIHGLYKYFCDVSCNDYIDVLGDCEILVSFTPGTPDKSESYKVTFSANGGKIDGQNSKDVYVTSDDGNGVSLGDSNMPGKAKRKGYTFKGWSTSQSAYQKFTGDTLITGDTTVYAYWKKDKKEVIVEKKDKEPEEKKIDNITQTRRYLVEVVGNKTSTTNSNDKNNKANNGSNNSSSRQYISKAELVSLSQSQNVPVASIGSGAVPLYAPTGIGSWAFVNLMLAILSALMALICVFLSFSKELNKKSLWFIAIVAGALANIIVFFATQDMKLNMVLTDGWTVVNVVLFVIVIAGVIKFLGRKGEQSEFTFS